MASYKLPPPDGTVRWAKYKARFERDADGKLPQGSSELMDKMMRDPALVARVRNHLDSMPALETDVRAVLSAAGVSIIQFLNFHNFSRELWSLTNRVSGLAAVNEALILRNKWAARGLSVEVLNRLSYELFSIRLPEAE